MKYRWTNEWTKWKFWNSLDLGPSRPASKKLSPSSIFVFVVWKDLKTMGGMFSQLSLSSLKRHFGNLGSGQFCMSKLRFPQNGRSILSIESILQNETNLWGWVPTKFQHTPNLSLSANLVLVNRIWVLCTIFAILRDAMAANTGSTGGKGCDRLPRNMCVLIAGALNPGWVAFLTVFTSAN